MKQRLAIASALLNDPEILILDEPTNGLDPQGIHQIREIIRKIASTGTTILLASHLLDEVEKVCNYVVIIRKGVKLYAGPVDQLNANHGFFELRSSNMEVLKNALTETNLFDSVKKNQEDDFFTAILTKPMEAEELHKILIEKGIILSHLVKKRESLEQQFLQLTNQKSA